MRVAIIDYQSGNLHSAAKAFERAASELGVTAHITVTADADEVRSADRIVLPGVGAFADCWAGLNAGHGMVEALTEAVLEARKPFFGICVGMQLLAERGLEHGVCPGLSWFEGEVRKIAPADAALKIPHMGWNTLTLLRPHPLFAGIPLGAGGWHAYFVHSYHFATADPASVLATADYGGPITAAVVKDNIFGTQFHPEKSQKLGLKLIANFLAWTP